MPGSVVTVQLGQCGNQVGTELFSTLAREADACSGSTRDEILDAFFRTPNARRDRAGSSKFPDDFPEASTPTARAVLIDMEPKVVQSSVRIAKKSGRWRFDTTRTLAFQAGSGNNWARGYNTYGGQVRETACELIRKEVEQCDFFGGFLLLQSMAGGTGAGLGAYVAQALRDEHPHAPLLNHCVWPYESGEVIVQSYNTLLTASALLDCSDGVIVAQNDSLHKTCVKQLRLPRPTFTDMNSVAAKQLAGVLLPSANREVGENGGLIRMGDDKNGGGPGMMDTKTKNARNGRKTHGLHDVVTDVCCFPAARLLSLRQLPVLPQKSVEFETFTWPGLLKRTRQMLLSGTTLEEGLDWGLEPTGGSTEKRDGKTPGRRNAYTKCFASSLFLRGGNSDLVDASAVGDPCLYPPWVPKPCSVNWSNSKFDGKEMSVTLLSNCQTPCPPIGRMLSRAYQMKSAGAYKHQYAEHGVGDDEFAEAFARVEDVLATYRAL